MEDRLKCQISPLVKYSQNHYSLVCLQDEQLMLIEIWTYITFRYIEFIYIMSYSVVLYYIVEGLITD